jgi:hypothetical protein
MVSSREIGAGLGRQVMSSLTFRIKLFQATGSTPFQYATCSSRNGTLNIGPGTFETSVHGDDVGVETYSASGYGELQQGVALWGLCIKTFYKLELARADGFILVSNN